MLDWKKGLFRPALFITSLSALLGASRAMDAFAFLFLRQDSGEPFVSAFSRNFDFFGGFLRSLGFALLGLTVAAGAALWGARSGRRQFGEIFSALSRSYAVLLVPVALSLACLLSLATSPTYPYGAGLAVSLALEGSFAELLAAGLFGASFLLALRHALVELEDSSPAETSRGKRVAPLVLGGSVLLFTLLTPSEFYREGFGQGNMFKYVRMAAALAGSGTLDIERAGENPDPRFRGFLARLPELGGAYLRASKELFSRALGAAREGELYTGEITARRANRSMFRSSEGGIYYINAPGPGILLVLPYLADRGLNRLLGAERQISVILFWQLLGALLVCEIVLSATEIAGRAAAITTALLVALTVPVLFYSFQIYPELPAALFLLYAFRKLVLDPSPTGGGVLVAGLALAALPWLHQKYSLVAAVLALYGFHRFLRREGRRWGVEPGKLLLLLAPLAISAYSIFLYNHALTGSLSPTATFTAAGRSSFEPLSFPKGLLGLLFDRENGLFVFSPIYLLALVGLPAFSLRQPRLLPPFLVVSLSYLLVIASFPYWAGAVSTMGRYILSLLPLFALPAAIAVRRGFSDGILGGAAVVLGSLSLAMSASFVRDLVPSYQPMLLWDRVLFSEPSLYLPSFLSEGPLGSGPAHFPKLLVQVALATGLLCWLGPRVRDGRIGPEGGVESYPGRMALGAGALLAALIGFGALLERFPGNVSPGEKPVFPETRLLSTGRRLTVEGENGFEGAGVWVPGSGRARFFLLTREPIHDLSLTFSAGPEPNRIEVRERGSAPAEIRLPPDGPHRRTVLLRKPYRFEGPRGARYLYVFTVRSRGSFVPAEAGRGEDRRSLGAYVTVG